MVTAKVISIYYIRSINGRTKDENIPPIGDFLVYRHEASVNIRLFGKRATRLSPDLFTIVEEDVGEGGSNRGE